MFEGGSDVFTSNRHALHNNEFLNYSGEDVQPADLPHPGRRALLLAPAGRLAVHLCHGAGREGGLREGHQAHAQVQHSVGEACSSLDTGWSLCVWRYSLFEGTQEQCSSFTVIVVIFSVTKL